MAKFMSIVFLFISFVLIYAGSYVTILGISDISFLKRAVKTNAVIVEILERRARRSLSYSYWPTVRYYFHESEYTEHSQFSYGPGKPFIGQHISIYVDPDNPSHMKLTLSNDNLYIGLMLLFSGLGMFTFAAISAITFFGLWKPIHKIGKTIKRIFWKRRRKK